MTKIARVRVFPYRLWLRSPLVTAHGRSESRAGAWVAIESESGAVGWGDACPIAGFGLESLSVARASLEALGDLLEGRDLEARESLSARIAEHCDGAPAARSASESALADLAARERGVALAQLLALESDVTSSPIAAVAVNALIAGATPEVVARAAREARAVGHHCFKLKVGALDLEADCARVFALREAVGEAALLRLDANGAWSEDAAARAIERLAPAGVEFIEQPLDAADLEGLVRLRRSSPIEIAADESASDEASALRVLELGAADRIVIKPSAIGGPRVAARVAARAHAAGIGVVVTSLLDSAIGVAAALQFAAYWAGVVGASCASGLATGALLRDDIASLGPIREGCLVRPPGAGIGIDPDPARLRALAPADDSAGPR